MMEADNMSLVTPSSTVRTYPDFFVVHPSLTYGLLIFLAVGTVLGTIGNILVILACVIDKHLRTPANSFVIHLAVADLGIAMITNPFSFIGLYDGHRIFEHGDQDLCYVASIFCFLFCLSSLAGMMTISINRMIAVAWNHKYSTIFTWRNCYIIIFLMWLYPIVMHLPSDFGWGGDRYDPKEMVCVIDRTYAAYFVFLAVVVIGVPTTVICVCYAKIFWTVYKSKQRLLAKRVADTHNAHQPVNMQRETRLAKTLFAIFIVFCVCWLPYGFLAALDRGDVVPKPIHAVAIQMAHANSCGINALVYYVTHDRFRRDFNLLLACRPHDLNNPQAGITLSSTVEDRSQTKPAESGVTRVTSKF